MQDAASIKERLLEAKAVAKAEMDLMLAQPAPSQMFIREHLRKYILAKYMLNEEICPTDVINDIMLISLERALHMDRALIKETEKGGACDRATPVMTKRILLFLTLQKELQAGLSPQALARTVTTADLADVVWYAGRNK